MIVIHENDFGREVAAACSRHEGFQAMGLAEALETPWEAQRGRFVAIALGATYSTRLAKLGDRLLRSGVPHSAAVLTDHLLMCGPLVLPPRGPCLRCALRRALSLVENPRTARMEHHLQQHQERHAGGEIRGHLPTLVRMASLRLQAHATLDPARSGRLSAVSFSNNRSIETPVIPLHGCACRGEPATQPGDRWGAALETALEPLLRA